MTEATTSAALTLFSRMAPPDEVANPAADRVIAGEPVATVKSFFESSDGRVSIGSWTCEPGHWRVCYDETEYCHILEGNAEVIDEAGNVLTVQPGDEFVIPAGFVGEWRILTRVTKRYVIIL